MDDFWQIAIIERDQKHRQENGSKYGYQIQACRERGEREGEGSSNNGLERESDNVEKVRVVLYVGEQGADNTREQRN